MTRKYSNDLKSALGYKGIYLCLQRKMWKVCIFFNFSYRHAFKFFTSRLIYLHDKVLRHVNTCDVRWINLLRFNTRTQLQLIKTDGKVKVSDSPNELIGAFRTLVWFICLANLLMFTLGYLHLQTTILMFTFAIKHSFRYMGFVLQLLVERVC